MFILLISLLAINGGNVNDMPINDVNNLPLLKQIQNIYPVSDDNSIRDPSQTKGLTSKKILIIHTMTF